MPYKILNWEKHQGRKNRIRNPWVKVEKSLLTSWDFFNLPKDRRWEMILLLLLADDQTGIIDLMDDQIAFKLRYKEGKIWDSKLFIGWFLTVLDASGNHMDAEGVPVDCSSTSNSTSNSKDLIEEDRVCHRGSTDPIEFILAGGEIWYCPVSKAKGWDKSFGKQVDVLSELLRAASWCDANPAKRKTINGIVRFLNTWLDTAVNSGKGTPPLTEGEKKAQRLAYARAKKADLAQSKRHNRRDNGHATQPTSVQEIIEAEKGANNETIE